MIGFADNLYQQGSAILENGKFIHCDMNEEYITLHDCVADRAYFCNCTLSFEFDDGFWILPDHPENNLADTVRTDCSKVEFILNDEYYERVIYVFEKNIFGSTVRKEWTLDKLLNSINSGKYKLEFLYQYKCYGSRIIECELQLDKRPYHKECIIKIDSSKANYCWNSLCKDRIW